MAISSTTVFRVRGLPAHRSLQDMYGIVERSLDMPSDISGMSIASLAGDVYQPSEQVATLSFLKLLPETFRRTAVSKEWPVDLYNADYDSTICHQRTLTFDTHFRGLTALKNPVSSEEAVDCVVVCGLGGHAFGSFKEKGTSHMWLRDSLPKDLPNLRILLYGYESGLDGSESALNISGIAETFIGHLRELRSQSETLSRPLIIIAHSLGGLLVKQAIIMLSRGDEIDKRQMQSIMGLIFFGVPNRGMDIESLRAIVGDQPNRYILESIGQCSDLLREQDLRFGLDFHYKDSPVFSFYETKTSPTALKIDGSWKMAGDRKMLVGPFSAKHPRHWEPELHHEGFDRTHSDLVKFSVGDVDYYRVRSRLNEIASDAKMRLISRYRSQEFPENLSPDENACLRTLAFAEMHSREGRVELAAQNTGDWLLENQDFQDWAQRKRLDEHYGFFWIQGNPGSGKSTLMKKVHSHIQTLSRDPTSIIAAFYFNARGSETEKSPAGLLRTLLHTLFQQISALRSRVMRLYHQKVAVLKSSWEWQFHELEEMLSSVVTASVLGKRNLVLCIDALDECDLKDTKPVITFFERLGSSSMQEKTKFNVCLSSRYWPQFTIQHCFKTRVERMNHGDIVSYIRQQMETVQALTYQSSQLAVLETRLEKKANGTFLWVVLVVQELLIAYENGATLGEINRILDTVPSDLENFYRRQMQNTKHDDGHQMLRMLQCVFYSMETLSPTELRYLLAFGEENFSSYSEWAQHSEYVANEEQMVKRIREKSKGLIEIAEIPEVWHKLKGKKERKMIVQFIHQSVKDFLSKDGFKSLHGREMMDDAASGHEFMKIACLNYLNITDLRNIQIIDFRFYSRDRIPINFQTLAEDHPLLEYAVEHLFSHAALAERHGAQQDRLRSHMSDNTEASFERWRYLSDLVSTLKREGIQGPETRPLHIFAQYGLLAPGLTKLEEDQNTQGGRFRYPLLAAAHEGHKDVVRCLLNSGADPNIRDWIGKTACRVAASQGHVDILKLLLENSQSTSTLQRRIEIAKIGLDPNLCQEILALLFPKTSISVSVIDQMCDLHAFDHNPPLLRWIIDNFKVDIFESERLWYKCVEEPGIGIPSIQILLDGVESIEISEKLLDALCVRDLSVRSGHESGTVEVAMFLFERGNLKVTEKFVDKISLLWKSSQILQELEASGFKIPPITCHQTLCALSNGSPESVSFYVQHCRDDAHSDELLQAAARNKRCRAQAVRILLSLRSIDTISHATVTYFLREISSNYDNLDVLMTFEDRWGTMVFSVDDVVRALANYRPNAVRFVLDRCERFSVTESHMIAALKNLEDARVVDVLLDYDPTFRVQDGLVAETLAISNPATILSLYLHYGNTLLLTENVVRAAAQNWNFDSGVEALEIIFEHDSSAKVSNTIVLEALRSRNGAGMVTLMLEKDPSISMEEDFLIAAASNTEAGALIFEALHAKSRIDFGKSTIEDARTRRTKRRRIASNPSPLIREDRHKSTPVTKKVIEAAAANPNVMQRWKLQSLFQKWGVLTDEDHKLFNSSVEQPSASLQPSQSSPPRFTEYEENEQDIHGSLSPMRFKSHS